MRFFVAQLTPVLLVLLCALALPATASCLSDEQIDKLVEAYFSKQPAHVPAGMTPREGQCSRDKFTTVLQDTLGQATGYKAGLTNPAVQARFNYPSPVRGLLFEPMLMQSGATVPANFGARAMFEADLLVRVSDAAINRATNPAQVLQAIDQVIPFIELPDLLVSNPGELDGPAITVGARLGIMGTAVAIRHDSEFLNALQNMQVEVSVNGSVVDDGRGSDVLGHPLNAVVWLASDLARDGLALKKGDLLSLGSFSRLLPPEPGMTVDVQYMGLPGDPIVRVIFE